MFEAGFAYILSKSLMNTRTKNPNSTIRRVWIFLFINVFHVLQSNFTDSKLLNKLITSC